MRTKDNHDGHRQRLLKRVEEEDLLEHELLEMLLFYVFKRRNTNDLAHRLLAKFGSIEALVSASMEELQSVEGIGKQTAQFFFLLGRFQVKRAPRGDKVIRQLNIHSQRMNLDLFLKSYTKVNSKIDHRPKPKG